MNPTISQTTTATYVSLTQFTLFPNLPPELCRKIYGHALPSVALGHRMFRVSAEYITTKPGEENKSYIEFTLLDNVHSASFKDIALLGACFESREVFISKFRHHLLASNGGLIRYADEDVVYIVNFRDLVDLTPILQKPHWHLLSDLTMHNLALPYQMFSPSVKSWGGQNKNVSYPIFTRAPRIPSGAYLPIILQPKNLKVLAMVELEIDTFSNSRRDIYLGWVRARGADCVHAVLRVIAFHILVSIRAGWKIATEAGKKRPLLRTIDVHGKWDYAEPKKPGSV